MKHSIKTIPSLLKNEGVYCYLIFISLEPWNGVCSKVLKYFPVSIKNAREK